MKQELSRLSATGALAWVLLPCCEATFPDLEVVRLGGSDLSQDPRDITVKGTLAYVGGRQSEAGRFDVLDVSDPARPRALGSHPTANPVESLTVVGGCVYLACGTAGVVVLEVSDPTQPREVGRYDTAGSAAGIAVENQIAYVADGEAGLQIINLSDPAHLTWLGGCDTPGSAHAVAVADGHAYVTDDQEGLQVIEIRDPAAPQKIGARDTSGRCLAIALAGEFACLLDTDVVRMVPFSPPELVASGEGVVVLTLREPGRPEAVGAYRGVGKFIGAPFTRIPRTKVVGQLAYVADPESGFKVLDLSDPTNPRRIGGYRLAGPAVGVEVSEDLAYVLEAGADRTSGRLHVVAINRGAQPARLGLYATDWEALSVTVDRGVAYVGTGVRGCHYSFSGAECGHLVQQRLETVDVRESARALRLGRFNAYVAELEVSGTMAFAAESYRYTVGTPGVEEAGRVGVLDMSNPASPQRVVNFGGRKGVRSIEVRNGMAYAAVGPNDVHFGPEGSCLQVIALEVPWPRLLGEHPTLEGGWHLTLVGDVIYLLSRPSLWGSSGYLELFDVRDPASPKRLSQCSLASRPEAVSVSGHLAYVAAGTGGLQIIDVSNLGAPKSVAAYEASAAVQDVVVIGKLAHLAVGGCGVEVLSLEDPLRPKRLGGNSAFDAWRLEVAGGLLYVAGGVDGLNILEATFKARLGAAYFDAHGVLHFEVNGPPGLEARIQHSSDLLRWEDWRLVTLPDGTGVLEDSEADRVPHRFYRAVGE